MILKTLKNCLVSYSSMRVMNLTTGHEASTQCSRFFRNVAHILQKYVAVSALSPVETPLDPLYTLKAQLYETSGSSRYTVRRNSSKGTLVPSGPLMKRNYVLGNCSCRTLKFHLHTFETAVTLNREASNCRALSDPQLGKLKCTFILYLNCIVRTF